MEQPDRSSPYSQAPAICPYPEPTPSSPHNPLPLPEIIFVTNVQQQQKPKTEKNVFHKTANDVL
jgi:hypothetical protein